MKKTKKVFLTLVAVAAVIIFAFLMNFFLFPAEKDQVRAAGPGCSEHDISGWAWSERIGWISLECGNCDSDYNGTTDNLKYAQCPTGQTVHDYGIEMDGDGGIRGYAWSEHIGWIQFAESWVSCPEAPCVSIANTTTGDVSGWARACTVFQSNCSAPLKPDDERGGWDGWIRLDKPSLNYEVTIEINNSDPDYEEFLGWAWGGDVIGWISFNCENEGSDCGGADTDYYATTSLEGSAPPNTDPVAVFSCDKSNCNTSEPTCIGYNTCGTIMVNSSYDPDAGDSITNSTWYIDSVEKDSCPSACNFTPASYGLADPPPESYTDYLIELMVEDENGGTHTTSTLPYYYRHERDAISDFECSIDDNPDWSSKDWSTECEDFTVPPGTIMYFKDNLGTSYDKSYPSCCGGRSITSRKWFKGGALFKSDSSEASTTVKLFPADIKLEITDDNNRTDDRTRQVFGESDIPRWREISP
jgi:hypothetical protein